MSAREQIQHIQKRVNASVIGQERVVERLVIALLANGNVLVEGLPGLAKLHAIKSLSGALESDFSRVQFTPDLLPSDVTAGEIYLSQDAGAGTFQFRQGPRHASPTTSPRRDGWPRRRRGRLLRCAGPPRLGARKAARHGIVPRPAERHEGRARRHRRQAAGSHRQRDGIEYNVTWIPDSFTEKESEPFDRGYMNRLYQAGRAAMKNGTVWARFPPGYSPTPLSQTRSAAK